MVEIARLNELATAAGDASLTAVTDFFHGGFIQPLTSAGALGDATCMCTMACATMSSTQESGRAGIGTSEAGETGGHTEVPRNENERVHKVVPNVC